MKLPPAALVEVLLPFVTSQGADFSGNQSGGKKNDFLVSGDFIHEFRHNRDTDYNHARPLSRLPGKLSKSITSSV